MSYKLKIISFILALSLCFSTRGYTDAKADIRSAIQTQYNRYSAALAARNVKVPLAIKASGYIAVDPTGKAVKRSQAEQRQHFIQLVTPPNAIRESFQIITLDAYGRRAEVLVQGVAERTTYSFRTGRTEVIHSFEKDLDLWVKVGGQWLWRRSKLLWIKTLP